MKPRKIPKKFKLFAGSISIVWDNARLNDKSVYGLSDYSKKEIVLSETIGVENLSEDTILDTFYHERTHAILDAMNRHELSEDEEFVDVFSKLLRQSIETAEFK